MIKNSFDLYGKFKRDLRRAKDKADEALKHKRALESGNAVTAAAD